MYNYKILYSKYLIFSKYPLKCLVSYKNFPYYKDELPEFREVEVVDKNKN